jgi:CBS domain containing-hemolysin-like protein
MSTAQIVYLVILGVCTVGSGFFSGSETALIGIGRERVHQLAGRGHRGERLSQLVADPDRLLSTLLVANNLVNILAAAVATTLFIELVGEKWGPWLATAAVTAVILVVGEITPKSLAARYPERFSLAVAPAIWQLSRVLRPIVRTFSAVTQGLFRLFRLRVDARVTAVTEEDIRAMAMLGEQGGEIERTEREIIDALFGLTDRAVKEVMTPRVDIYTLDAPVTMVDVRRAITATGHSRFPVVRSDLDHIEGVLFVKDLLRTGTEPDADGIARMLRPPYYVPESTPILRLLHQMRVGRVAFAMILDEHGGIEGVVTLKDLVAELVGELQDEYDPTSPSVVRIGTGQWLADGRLPVEDLVAATGREIPSGPYSTVGGLFMAVAGRIPGEGESTELEGLRLVVVRMDRNRIDRIRIEAPS